MFKILGPFAVHRTLDGATIPRDPGNRDWQDYQEWLAAGNTPAPADPSPAPADQADVDQLSKQLKALALTFAQITGTPPATVRSVFRQKMETLA